MHILYLNQNPPASPALKFIPFLSPRSLLTSCALLTSLKPTILCMCISVEPSTEAWVASWCLCPWRNLIPLPQQPSVSNRSFNRVGLHETLLHPCWQFSWLGLVKFLCMIPCPSESMCATMLSWPKWYLDVDIYFIWLLHSVIPLYHDDLWVSGDRRNNTDIPFRAEHDTVSYSLIVE